MIELYKGEKRYIPMALVKVRNVDKLFTIENVDCRVVDDNWTEIESGLGVIKGNEVMYFLDTTSEDYVYGRNYIVCFDVTIIGSPEVIKGQVKVKIKAKSKYSYE